MRILHVVPMVDDKASHGGPLAAALYQCAELRRRGHEAVILAGWRGAGPPPDELEGIPARLFRTRAIVPGSRGPDLPGRLGPHLSLTLTGWLGRHAASFDVVHLHFARDLVSIAAACLLERARVPYVVQTHGRLRPPDGLVARWADRHLTVPALREASRRLVTDPAERQSISELTGSPIGISLLTRGIALPTRQPRSAPSETELDVVFMARLQTDKGVMTFAEAAASLLDAGLDARFDVIGPDGGEAGTLRRFIRERPRLDGRLRYQGPLSHADAVKRLQEADLFVEPAQDGVQSMALLEALAAGVPSICTTSYPHAVLLRARRAARVIKPSPDALARAVHELATDPTERSRLGRFGRVAVAHGFDIAVVVDELEGVYESAVTGGCPSVGGAGPESPTLTSVEELPDLLWVTTEVTPYRLALWREIARMGTLTVALLAASQANWRQQLEQANEPFTVVQLHAKALREVHGVTLYAPTRSLRTLIRRRPGSVVLDGWESPAFHTAARWARRCGVPVVATYRGMRVTGSMASSPVARVQRRLLRRADAVLTSDAGSVDALLELGVAAERIAFAAGHGGGDAVPRDGRRGPHVTTPVLPAIVDLREGHRFLYLGPLIERRNVAGLLCAFQLARGLGDVLTVAGSGPLQPGLIALAESLGIDDGVIFLGDLDRAGRAAAFASAQTLVLPSTDEVWSRDVDEAMDAGLHAVVSTACGVAESVSALPCVFVAEPNPTALAKAMMRSKQRWIGSRRLRLVTDPAGPLAGPAAVAPRPANKGANKEAGRGANQGVGGGRPAM